MERFLVSSRLMIYIFLGFSVGIVLGQLAGIPVQIALYLLIGLSAWVLFSFLRKAKTLVVASWLLVVVWGVFWTGISQPLVGELPKWQGATMAVKGQVHSITNHGKQFTMVIEEVEGRAVTIKPKVLVTVPSYLGDSSVKWGDEIGLTGRLLETQPRTNPGGFSEQEYWRNSGVAYKLIATQGIEVHKESSGFTSIINQLRENIYLTLSQGMAEEERALALGLILGDRSQIDPELYEKFQRLGVVHIFAVSGLHVGFLVALYLGLAHRLAVSKGWRLLGALIVFGGYAILTGLTPSVVRASIMAFVSLVLIGELKHKDFYSILATAGLVILLINPLSLFTIGFQLSFVTTWGLVYLYPFAQSLLFFLPERGAKVLAVPIAAQLASLPLVAYYFNTVSIWAPLANVVLVLIIAVLIPILFISLILAFGIFFLAQPFLLFAEVILFFLTRAIIALSSLLPYSHTFIASPPIPLIVFYYLLLTGCGQIKRIRELMPLGYRFRLALALVLMVVWLVMPSSRPLVYTFLDVGQGDGCVIQTPFNQFIVIDGGPPLTTITKYLGHIGANKVDLVILSHSHLDHINGLFKVLEDLPVNVLVVPPNMEECQLMEDLKRVALAKGTQVLEATAGLTINVPGGIGIEVLSPRLEHLGRQSANNGSLVLEITYGEVTALFTGDIENKIINEMMANFNPIHIFKVPHHGSRSSYSPQLYQVLDPKVAIIPVGRNNRYSHPHQEVIKGLEERGIPIYRNDKQGAVQVKTKGSNIQLKAFLKEEPKP